MKIEFSPMRHTQKLTLEKRGEALIVNDEMLDFSALAEGESVPLLTLGNIWFAGPVSRENGELHIPLILPHGADAPQETRFPEALHITRDGPIKVPAFGR